MFGAIYRITFPNDKTYIGRTRLTSIRQLISRYEYETRHHNRPVSQAVKKYGINNCNFEFLFEYKDISDEELNILEIQCIKNTKSMIFENGYNITEGGQSGAAKGKLNSRYIYLEESVVKEINRLRSIGKSLSYITRTLNLPNRDIVKRRLYPHLLNVKTREDNEFKGTWKNIDRSILENLLSQGKTVPEICVILNVGKSIIRKRLELWNLKTARARKKS